MRPKDTVDLVHLRNLTGAFADWSFVYQQALACLKPGGAIEVLDFCDGTSFVSRLPPDSELRNVAEQIDQGAVLDGRPRGTQHLDPQVLEQLGYVDVQVRDVSIPLDPANSSVGKLWLIACLLGIEASGLRLLTKYMGWEPDEARASLGRMCDQFKAAALNPELSGELRFGLKVLTARKPLVPGHCTAQSVAENGQIVYYYSGDDSTIGS